MRLSRRGLILGGSALLAGCSSAASTSQLQLAGAVAPTLPIVPERTRTAHVQMANAGTTIDPHGVVRPDLIERARAAMDVHGHKISKRDRMYLVDFQKFSGEDRLYEVDLEGGWVTAYRTSHGRGSDPAHSGYAQQFSNRPDSHMSSIGAYATAGASWGSQQGPNVLLDGLEYSNNLARERAIIIHGADYADPAFLARQGKLGRSYGCFSVSHADLVPLRERMGEGRLLFAMT
ncbi:murein L,D-transpeptidase catalytic domain family protein [Brevundimonas diminuta]|uniref:murein L,D-transpeptidase catalytic domain-containing protein n=1 Tax=Brevundimonas diminuta TaxID=293 RepID=UPI0020982AE5|nr:murein L,D-transpeptidase catalytic domain family protein [Brevundimonas diminuta]MCO8017702.1 murein L,D-transpeptidase catalytic domain family protein [Brevundimonas diminuta]MCO8021222.1 murein L,D-transpeptidase catalytic domain family protein [Brevundimonas diminuta]